MSNPADTLELFARTGDGVWAVGVFDVQLNGKPASQNPALTWANDLTLHEVDPAVSHMRFSIYRLLVSKAR